MENWLTFSKQRTEQMQHFIPENINISQAHENEGENGHFTETFYKGANLDSACFSSTHNFLPIFYLIITSLNFLVIQTHLIKFVFYLAFHQYLMSFKTSKRFHILATRTQANEKLRGVRGSLLGNELSCLLLLHRPPFLLQHEIWIFIFGK